MSAKCSKISGVDQFAKISDIKVGATQPMHQETLYISTDVQK